MTSGERDQVRAELAHEERVRARMLTGLTNTHLSHWKHPLQLAASGRHIARLRALLAEDDNVIQPADPGTDLDGPCAVAGRGGAS